MKEKIERIRKWRNGNEAGPYTLEINPTNRCNLSCRFCWLRSAKPDKFDELSDEKILDVIEEAVELGVKEIRIPGSGEPLLRKELIEKAIRKIKNNSIHGLLITNGTLMEKDLMEQMVKWGWDNLTVSLDGPDAMTHDYLRNNKGTFGEVIEKLKVLRYLKSQKGTRKPKLRINTVLTNKNYDRLSELVELVSEFGCEDIQLQPMTPFSEVGEECVFDGKDEELDKYLERASQAAEEQGIYNNFENFVSSDIVKRTDEIDEVTIEGLDSSSGSFSSAPCYQPWYSMVILPDGTVGQCSIFGGDGGEQIKGKSLREVWFGEYFEEVRRRILDHDLFSYCKNCCVPLNFENRKIRNTLKCCD